MLLCAGRICWWRCRVYIIQASSGTRQALFMRLWYVFIFSMSIFRFLAKSIYEWLFIAVRFSFFSTYFVLEVLGFALMRSKNWHIRLNYSDPTQCIWILVFWINPNWFTKIFNVSLGLMMLLRFIQRVVVKSYFMCLRALSDELKKKGSFANAG